MGKKSRGSKGGDSGGGSGGGASGVGLMAPLDIEDKPIVINQWDGAAVKNTLDDCVHKYTLDTMEGYEEDFFETDLRLFVCFLACAFAAFGCVWGLFVSHPESTPVVSVCVIGYFSLVTLLSIYQTFFEEPVLLCARKGDAWVKAFTDMERYSTTFSVTLQSAGKRGDKPHEITKSFDIANYFYEDGELAHGNVAADVEDMVGVLVALQRKDTE